MMACRAAMPALRSDAWTVVWPERACRAARNGACPGAVRDAPEDVPDSP